MSRNSLPKVIVIVGANASGKSAFGIELAKKYNGEIISADSRQIYNGFDLCCGKATREERNIVPHHLLDVCQIEETFSVSDYQKKVYSIVPQIIQRGHIPFIVGGTGLYISSIVDGYEFKEETYDPDYHKELEAKSLEELQSMLPDQAFVHLRNNHSDLNNKRRIIRLLERIRNGEDLEPHNDPQFSTLQLGIRWEKEVLHQRIEERLALRLEQGMIDEVRSYLDTGGNPEHLYRLGLEYRYITWYLTGKYASFQEFYRELSHAIKQFAKRQLTWFKRDERIHWLNMQTNGALHADQLMEAFLWDSSLNLPP